MSMNPELAKALLAVQAEAPTLQRDGINPHFKAKYVTLETLMETILPVLNRHGVVVVQSPTEGGLATALIHAESGATVESVIPLLLDKDNSQGQGSAITYARRYALMAMLGLVADEDDDGAAASKPKGGKRSGGSKPREFDPGVDLAPGAIKVQTEEDADSLRREAASWMPDQPWSEIEKLIVLHLFGEPYEELAGGEKREFYTRFANLIVRVGELAGGGDFPPPTPAQIEEGFAWAFKGMTIALGSDLPSEEAPADELPAEELEGAENAS